MEPDMTRPHGFKRGFLATVAIMVVTVGLALASGSAAQAQETGPRLALNVFGGVTCDAPSEPTECTVPLGSFFTLAVEVIEAPAAGYINVQSWIDYGSQFYDASLAEDEFGPGTCGDGLDNSNDTFPDRLDTDCVPAALTYHSTGDQGEEIVWPDSDPDVVFRGETAAAAVHHSALTALIPPLPVSTHVGSVVEIVMECSASESTTDVSLLPLDHGLARGNGTGFVEPDGLTQVPSSDTLTITCAGVVPPADEEEQEEPTPTPAPTTAPALPPTGTGGAIDGSGGNTVLLAMIGGMLAAAAGALAFAAWRRARGHQVS